ncbi:cobalamin cluster protein [Halobacteriales archaeon SW_8_68_21]|nr:MAG: cobalamin cluster protein [Halobacteriales archaeon SW_8_68_21]
MSTNTDTVADRFAAAGTRIDPMTALVALALVAALGFGLLFAQEPLVHDALHDFRHGAGIVCH